MELIAIKLFRFKIKESEKIMAELKGEKEKSEGVSAEKEKAIDQDYSNRLKKYSAIMNELRQGDLTNTRKRTQIHRFPAFK